VGLALLLLLALAVLPALRKQHWLMLGVIGYCLPICLRWHHPNSRYLLPIAPLLLAFAWDGAGRLVCCAWVRALLVALAAGIAASNVVLFIIDAAVMHNRDFYGTYYAGQAKELTAVGTYAAQHTAVGETIGLREIDKTQDSPSKGPAFALRGLCLITDRPVQVIKGGDGGEVPSPNVIRLARNANVTYLIVPQEVSPWRIWHFRSPWLQKTITRRPVEYRPYYRLFRIDGEAVTEVPVTVDIPEGYGRRVPGL
jgi:hypothetical protein